MLHDLNPIVGFRSVTVLWSSSHRVVLYSSVFICSSSTVRSHRSRRCRRCSHGYLKTTASTANKVAIRPIADRKQDLEKIPLVTKKVITHSFPPVRRVTCVPASLEKEKKTTTTTSAASLFQIYLIR